MLGRRVQGPWGCPCSAPLLMVNGTGQQPWCRLLQAISTAITPGTGCTLLFVCIPASVPRPLVLQLPCDTQLPPRLSPSHPTVALWAMVSPAVLLLKLKWRR